MTSHPACAPRSVLWLTGRNSAAGELVSDPTIPAPDDTGAFEVYIRQLVRELESWVNALGGPHVCNLPHCKMRRYGL